MTAYYNQIEYDRKRNLKRIKDAYTLLNRVSMKELSILQAVYLSNALGALVKLKGSLGI
jgi:hypothetical protein